MDLQPLIEHSSKAVPAFAMVADIIRPGRSSELDVSWSQHGWLEPVMGEEILGRWMCLKTISHILVGKTDGLPVPVTGDDVCVLTPILEGAGPLVLTSKRLIGSIIDGATVCGPVTREGALLFTLPLSQVEGLDVLRTKGWSGLKERGVMASIAGGGFLFADLDRAVDDGRSARSSSRIRAAQAIVQAAAAVQRPSATPEQAAILDRALAGDWRKGEDDDLEIELAPPDPEATEQAPQQDARGVPAQASDDQVGEVSASAIPGSEPRASASEAGETEPNDVPAQDAEVAQAAVEPGAAGLAVEAPNAETEPATAETPPPARLGAEDGWECPTCGTSNLADHRFCTNCGREQGPAPEGAGLGDADSVEHPVALGCGLCDCVATPEADSRFCRVCGHPAAVHAVAASSGASAGEDTLMPTAPTGVRGAEAELEASGDAPGAEGGAAVDYSTADTSASEAQPEDASYEWYSWKDPARAQPSVRSGVPASGSDEPQQTSPAGDAEAEHTPHVDVALAGSGAFAPPPRPTKPLVFGWRSAAFVVALLVGIIVLVGIVKSLSSSPESFSYTDYEQTTDYEATDTDPYATDPYTTTDTYTDPYTTTETNTYSTAPTATAALGAPVVERQLSVVTAEGYTGSLTVSVYDVYPASDFPPLPLTYRSTISGCEVDPATDAVIPVSFQLENTSATTVTPLAVTLYARWGSGISSYLFAGDVRYSDSNACLDQSTRSDGVLYTAYWENATGHISDDFYVVVHDFYTASALAGDPERLADLSLEANVGFGPTDGTQSRAGASELVPMRETWTTSSSSSTSSTQPPPSASANSGRRTTRALAEAMVAPAPPYRCVSPFVRDHDGRMELEFRSRNGATTTWASRDASDTSDNFLFCGGSVTYDLPGYASAPIRFQDTGSVSRIVFVRGIVGADRDEGAPGRRVALTISYEGERICDVSTDSQGHAKRFSCRGFPASSSLSELELRLDVKGDRRQGVFAGIVELEATVDED